MGNLAFTNVMPYHVPYLHKEKEKTKPKSSIYAPQDYAPLATKWCSDTYGPHGERWKRIGTVFCFASAEDAMFFKLKFGY